MNFKIKEIDIADVVPGDTILHNGEQKTVTKCNIKRDDFMGVSIFGDSYNLGYKKVKKVIFNKP